MKYKILTSFFGFFFLLSSVSDVKSMQIDGIEFYKGGNAVHIGQVTPGIIVCGQDKSEHYQLVSKSVPVPPKYSIHFEMEVGTDPAGTNSTPVGVGILSGDQSVWVKNPAEKTYNPQLGRQQGDIEVDGSQTGYQTHSVLVFTNQGQHNALANFIVRSVKFIDPVNNRILLPIQQPPVQQVPIQQAPVQPAPVYHQCNHWPQQRESGDRKGEGQGRNDRF